MPPTGRQESEAVA